MSNETSEAMRTAAGGLRAISTRLTEAAAIAKAAVTCAENSARTMRSRSRWISRSPCAAKTLLNAIGVILQIKDESKAPTEVSSAAYHASHLP